MTLFTCAITIITIVALSAVGICVERLVCKQTRFKILENINNWLWGETK